MINKAFFEGLSESDKSEFLKQLDLLNMLLQTLLSGIFALESINLMFSDVKFSDNFNNGLNCLLKSKSKTIFEEETINDFCLENLQKILTLINSVALRGESLNLETLQKIFNESDVQDIIDENKELKFKLNLYKQQKKMGSETIKKDTFGCISYEELNFLTKKSG